MKILLLTRYDELGASSRLRFLQYLPYLRGKGMTIDVAPLFSNKYLHFLYSTGRKSIGHTLQAYLDRLRICHKSGAYDLLWIEKECFPMLPAFFEHLPISNDVPYLIDYDDAIHHNYDGYNSWLMKQMMGQKLQKIVSRAATVTVGNKYLASWARSQGSLRVEEIPTVIDLDNYKNIAHLCKVRTEFRVGWIGMPATTNYLWLVREALVSLSKKIPLLLVVIGAGKLENFGVPIERHEWNENTEAYLLSTLDIGIMPLSDSPWERGKCGYKLIQYMSCGLPVVASPVGANEDIVEDGVNGYLVEAIDQWEKTMYTLYINPDLRMQMGIMGRRKVEQFYCLQQTAPRVEKILKKAAGLC